MSAERPSEPEPWSLYLSNSRLVEAIAQYVDAPNRTARGAAWLLICRVYLDGLAVERADAAKQERERIAEAVKALACSHPFAALDCVRRDAVLAAIEEET